MNILLINPWIEDFSAYDFWSRPLNLLRLASLLRKRNCNVAFIDCMDRFNGAALTSKNPPEIKGHYRREIIDKPDCLKFVPRNFKRYGISKDNFIDECKKLQAPDAIVFACNMTYWYSGAEYTIQLCKNIFPDTTIYIGGIYPFLFPEHAKANSTADKVLTNGNFNELLEELKLNPYKDDFIDPAYDLLTDKKLLPVVTSIGCPYSCEYCASPAIHKKHKQYSVEEIYNSLSKNIIKYKSQDIVFYDDALIFNSEKHLLPLLNKLIENFKSLNFYTPNAMHARFVNWDLAQTMYHVGFRSIRFGLEFTNEEKQKITGGKVFNDEYEKAINLLIKAGFKKDQIYTYLLCNYPGQTYSELKVACKFISACGSRIQLALYSPIPKTTMGEKVLNTHPYNHEPLLTNNSIRPYSNNSNITLREYESLKRFIKSLNK